MTQQEFERQWRHLQRKWMKGLKLHFQMNKVAREKGFTKSPDPKRLPA